MEDEARHGVVVVHRGADVVFHPRSLASYIGTPTVLRQPDELVTGNNIRGGASCT
jgi:hypothetical protein